MRLLVRSVDIVRVATDYRLDAKLFRKLKEVAVDLVLQFILLVVLDLEVVAVAKH